MLLALIFTSTWPLGDLMSIIIFEIFPREGVACYL